jgi:hypothetical protein
LGCEKISGRFRVTNDSRSVLIFGTRTTAKQRLQGGREDLVKSEVNVTNTKRANSSNELLCMLLWAVAKKQTV